MHKKQPKKRQKFYTIIFTMLLHLLNIYDKIIKLDVR